MLPIQVPAHIRYAPRVVNHIQVAPGTNWDFSRSAVVTPIVQLANPPLVVAPKATAAKTSTPAAAPALAPYQESTGIPQTKPAFQLRFYPNSAAVSARVRRELRKLPKTHALIVVAYPQPGDVAPEKVCKARARVITAILRASGHKVSEIKALGRSTVAASAAFTKPDSVEIFLAPAG